VTNNLQNWIYIIICSVGIVKGFSGDFQVIFLNGPEEGFQVWNS